MTVGLAANRTRNALVALLVARIANGETRVPARGRTRSGRPGATVSADTAIAALPAHLRNVGQQRPDAIRVVALIARVAHQHLRVLARRPASDAHFAIRALPSSADARRRRQTDARTMIMAAARHAQQLQHNTIIFIKVKLFER